MKCIPGHSRSLKISRESCLLGKAPPLDRAVQRPGQQVTLPTLFSAHPSKEQPKGQEWLERGSDQALC